MRNRLLTFFVVFSLWQAAVLITIYFEGANPVARSEPTSMELFAQELESDLKEVCK